jgi:hypothetical protein
MDPLLKDRELGLVYEPFEQCMIGIAIFNGFIASASGHWIWPILMNHIEKHYNSNKGVVANTGPWSIAKMVMQNNIHKKFPKFFIPTCLIIPITYFGNISIKCPKDIKNVAYCYTKWSEGTGRVKEQKLTEERSITNGYMPICLTNPLLSILVYVIYNKISRKS